MKRSMSTTTIVEKAIRLIRNGDTWEGVSANLNYSVGYLQKLCKDHYKRSKSYNDLLAIARMNKRNQPKEATKKEEPEDKEILVVETGFVLSSGVKWLLDQSLEIYMPEFCLRELENLAKDRTNVEDILTVLYTCKNVNFVKITRHQQKLFKEPRYVPKYRSVSIVSLCCLLKMQNDENTHMRLYTNSAEVRRLAEEQAMDNFRVIKVKNSR